MKQQFTVAIATKLDVANIRNMNDFPYTAVLDTRNCEAGNARAIEDPILSRLTNYFIEYAQEPLDFCRATQRSKIQLMQTIADIRGEVLVLTDQLTEFEQLCKDHAIPFRIVDRSQIRLVAKVKSFANENHRRLPISA